MACSASRSRSRRACSPRRSPFGRNKGRPIMGVIDKVTDRLTALLPATRQREDPRTDLPPVGAEVLALRDDLDRWLQRFLEDPWGLPSVGEFQLVPAVN